MRRDVDDAQSILGRESLGQGQHRRDNCHSLYCESIEFATTGFIRCHTIDPPETKGGVWADATLWCARPLDDWLEPSCRTAGFFGYDRPAADRPIATWFLAAAADSRIASLWHAAVLRLATKTKYCLHLKASGLPCEGLFSWIMPQLKAPGPGRSPDRASLPTWRGARDAEPIRYRSGSGPVELPGDGGPGDGFLVEGKGRRCGAGSVRGVRARWARDAAMSAAPWARSGCGTDSSSGSIAWRLAGLAPSRG